MDERQEHRRGPGAAGGGARLNLLLVLAAIAALVYVGAQFVPMAYRGWAFETFMQDTVNNAVAMDKTPEWVEQQLRKSFEDHGVPEDATVEVERDGKRISATVQYTQPISLVFTEYEYEFDETKRSLTVTGGP